VERIGAVLGDDVRLHSPVQKLVRHRRPDGSVSVELVTPTYGPETFDAVVLAAHSDQALRLLGDPTPTERELLSAIPYQRNLATLHTDERMLPRNHRARASWNYHITPDRPRAARLTYWMNDLQTIDAPAQLLVTLNRSEEIDPTRVLTEIEYDHPVFDAGAIAAQSRKDEIQGRNGVWFAGAYWGHGFHEDGVQSALDVCERLGCRL
jgi:predicted NAD/FAD-binding protein